MDCQFNINLDVYDNHMLDIYEIGRLKAALEADALGDEATLATTPPENAEASVHEEDGEEEDVEELEEAMGEVGDMDDNVD